MNNLSNSELVCQAAIHWNENPEERPEKSGAYRTRDDRNGIWIKYFDASYEIWYMSWSELKADIDRNTARISRSDLPRHVAAWAPIPRNDSYPHAVKQIGQQP